MKYLCLFFICSCSSISIPLDLDAGLMIESRDASTPLVCDKLICSNEYMTYCGLKTNNCGDSINCGECKLPFKCGVQDLQDYSPTPNYCGLDCTVVSLNSQYCKAPFYIEHECPNTKEMVDFLSSDKFTYTCQLIPHGTTYVKLHFCCGL